HDGGALLRIIERGHIAARLVEHVVALLLGAVKEFAIDADVVAGSVVASAEGVDYISVDLDAPFENDLLGLAAAGDACLGKDLLQAVALKLIVRFRFWGGGRLRHGVGLLTAELLIAVEYIESLLSPVSAQQRPPAHPLAMERGAVAMA